VKIDDPEKQLAAALGRVPSGLFILTLKRDGIETGMLASWVQQCSFQPPLISLALKPDRPIAGLLDRQARFTLNILENSQTDMISHFGRGFALQEDAFQNLDVDRSGPCGAVLAEGLAVLECQVVDRRPAGDHDLIVAQVVAGRVLDEGQPMVHVRKNGFHY
jgi:flavin reductase (DIM6/NTAB) family NADH-FMN oxidoreductase RutF